MSQPIPPSPYTHVCVICYIHHQRQTEATHVTHYRGLAVCDEHREHLEKHGPAALTVKKRR